jgi:hypothetical protein
MSGRVQNLGYFVHHRLLHGLIAKYLHVSHGSAWEYCRGVNIRAKHGAILIEKGKEENPQS